MNRFMRLIEDIPAVEQLRREWQHETVAFVPTMGALHEGHLSLISKARTLGSRVIVSIFVNPMQFGPNEDFSRYPRPKERDLALCESYGVDAVFYPADPALLYPNGLHTMTQVVPPKALTENFCGASRPGHFAGMATVVLKLFNMVQPQYAVFGEKDAQQLAIIRQMVRDLNVPVEIIPAPTVREADGLAKSSRNAYIKTDTERAQARLLSRLLITAQELYQQSEADTSHVLETARSFVINEALYPDFALEYFAAVDQDTFQPVDELTDNTRLLVAAKVGPVRLIDNALVSEPLRLLPQTSVISLGTR